MNIKHKQEENGGAFLLIENGNTCGEMTYELSLDKALVINHTEVDEDLRGKDFGEQLVNAAVEYARSQSIKIIPVCSFACSVFEKTNEYKDVLERDK